MVATSQKKIKELNILQRIEADDLYYGTKKDFKDRHENIKIFIKNLMLKYERTNVKK